MSDETGTVRILDADPERVVSVTVGDLETLLDDGMDVEAGFVGIDTVTVHERTCHNSAPHYLRFRCSECHHVIYHDDANETGESDEDGIKFCPNCGARVTRGGER